MIIAGAFHPNRFTPKRKPQGGNDQLKGIYALAAGYVLSQFYRTFLAVLTPVLSAEIGMTKGDFAFASGLWFFAFAAMQFIVGVGLDRFGPRRTAFFILAPFGTIGGLLFAFAQSPWMIILAMGFIGIGLSPVLMAAVFLFAKNFEPKKFAALTSMIIAVGAGGAVLGASPLAYAADLFGWRIVMGALTALTLLVSIWIYQCVIDPESEGSATSSGFKGYFELFKLRTIWPLVPVVFFSYAVMIGIRGLWAGPFLTTMHGADAKLIGNVTLGMSLTMVIATLFVGKFVAVLQSEKRVGLLFNSVVVLICLIIAAFPAMPLWTASLCFVIITLFGASFVAQAAHGRLFYPDHLLGRGVTLLNAISIGGAGIMQFATGALVSATANPGAPGLQWSWLFGFYGVALGLACIVYAFSQETRAQTG